MEASLSLSMEPYGWGTRERVKPTLYGPRNVAELMKLCEAAGWPPEAAAKYVRQAI